MNSLKARYFLALVILATLTACSFAREVIHIGATISLTGQHAAIGALSEKGYRLWEQDVNRRGGLLGKPVKITILDDKSDPELAKELYQNLIIHRLVDFVMAPYSSEITEAVTSVTELYRFPLLVSGASADSLWDKDRKYLFGIFVTSKKYTVGFLELLAKARISKIAIVSADNSFARDIEFSTKEWASRFQLNVIFSERYKTNSPDIEKSIYAAQLSGAHALIVAGEFQDAINAKKALKRIGWKPKAFYATNGPAIEKFAEVLTQKEAEDTFTTSQWEAVFPYPGAKEFATSFYDTYEVAPSYHAASAYAAGQILEAALNKTKSFDREKIRNALYGLDTITIIGRYGVDSHGKQNRHFASTVQWQNGKKEVVSPSPKTTAKPVWR
jgi:branched-chain amino acid transport system substrate-binding protein